MATADIVSIFCAYYTVTMNLLGKIVSWNSAFGVVLQNDDQEYWNLPNNHMIIIPEAHGSIFVFKPLIKSNISLKTVTVLDCSFN